MSHHVCAGSGTQVLCNSSKHSYVQGHLPSSFLALPQVLLPGCVTVLTAWIIICVIVMSCHVAHVALTLHSLYLKYNPRQ